MSASDAITGVEAPACPYTGPDCTFGLDYAFNACYQLVKPAVFDTVAKARVAVCILSKINAYEQTVLNTNSYILTLWPAIVGIIGSFGPDASDIVCDSIWWTAMLAITSAGLPGSSRNQPAHHLTVSSFDQGQNVCREWEYSHDRPREIARHRNSRVQASGKFAFLLEFGLFLLTLAVYVLFNYFFISSLSSTVLLGRSSPYVAGAWYWLSAMPITLLFFSEMLQDRVDLYEPRSYRSTVLSPLSQDDPARLQLTSDTLHDTTTSHISFAKSPLSRQTTSGLQMTPDILHESPTSYATYSRTPLSRQSTALPFTPDTLHGTPTSHASYTKVPLSRQTTTRQFAKVTRLAIPFFSKWFRIIGHQWSGTQYRLLVRPASQKWPFQIWKVVVGLVRVTLFTVGSVQMGNIVLFPPGAPNTIPIALLVVASAVPRLTVRELQANSRRGADLVVNICPIDVAGAGLITT